MGEWVDVQTSLGTLRVYATDHDSLVSALAELEPGAGWTVLTSGDTVSTESKATEGEQMGKRKRITGWHFDQRDTPQQKTILRSQRTAQVVRRDFPAGTRVQVRTGSQEQGTVVRHVPGNDAQGGTLVIRWDRTGTIGRHGAISVEHVPDCPSWHFLPGPMQADEERTQCPRSEDHAEMRQRWKAGS